MCGGSQNKFAGEFTRCVFGFRCQLSDKTFICPIRLSSKRLAVSARTVSVVSQVCVSWTPRSKQPATIAIVCLLRSCVTSPLFCKRSVELLNACSSCSKKRKIFAIYFD